jgi:geranyl-CoA carboxylase alpha subunit
MIESILIANRGEIACRIITSCHRLGIRTVAVYSDADANALHVKLADEALHIGPSPASESYLLIDKIIVAAQRANVDAIHPGYGFLSENAGFARACHDAGLIFIGPPVAAIEIMGNKQVAKELAIKSNVPVIPGYNGKDQSDRTLQKEAKKIGFPLLVKAAAGGGGKGMRVVHDVGQLADALASARHEAKQAFGNDELILEQVLSKPRHIEFQLLGDQHGHLINLGERECSIQRRYQKVIEESPSTALTPDLRQKMGEVALTIGRAIGYFNAGTVEFLLDEDGQFYFLEMNTRLQVEHPITEMITGFDLVEWQIRIAEGRALTIQQQDVFIDGHAIEARLYAENPANDFLPVTGDIYLWLAALGEGIRVDHGIDESDSVSIYYDPLLAKIIAYGENRHIAVRRLSRALQTTTLLGIKNNLGFLRDIIRHPAFQSGNLNTHFLDDNFANWQQPTGDISLAALAVTLKQVIEHPQLASNYGYWRNNPNQPQHYRYQLDNDDILDVYIQPVPRTSGQYEISLSAEHFIVELNEHDEYDMILTVAGWRQKVVIASDNDNYWVQTREGVVQLKSLSLLPIPKASADAGGSLRAPMPGSVLAVMVEVGQTVKKGDLLMKLEAMKMEHTIYTAADGVVEAVYFTAGDTVEADEQLLKISEDKHNPS